ncbi:hypothetical protein FACS189426_01140 [Bacteroidia bacterium]|nr:hypothetical protein FACS189426_01140 [Bacteroidia bacterium]
MRKRWVIIGFIVFFTGCFVSVNGKDTLQVAKKENLPFEPVSFDSLTYHRFKKQHFFNYYEKTIKQESFLQSLYEQFNRWLRKKADKTIEREAFNILLFIIGIVVIIILLVILYIQKPGIFYFNKKNNMIYTVDYEDIVNQDFDSLSEQSVKEELYADAIRWLYLKTLKILHEKELISYDAFKTVNEYVYEIKNTELRKLFKNLSQEFVYFRYGKGNADAEKFAGFKQASEEIIKIRRR